MRADFDWIFFDCFNTLIDDFDESGDESGLGSLPDMAVDLRFFARREDFIHAYRQARGRDAGSGRETHFDCRLTDTLAASPTTPSAALITDSVAAMLKHWHAEYTRLLRATPGADTMLSCWATRKRLAVISNFFLPDYPAQYLRTFGFDSHFQFVLDSAGFGYKKPHPAIFDEALRLAGIVPTQAHRVLMIGDRLDLDVNPARQLGMQTLHFNRKRTRPQIADTPDGIPHIHDWAEFR